MAQLVVVLDASIVNVALPSIGRGLHFSQASLSWVVNAYVLTFGGFLLLGGRMADLIGRRKMFIAGLIVFALASLAGGLAQSEGWLIAARAFQGLGAAMLSPAALSIVTTTFAEGADRNKALGVWGAVAGSGGAAGVLLGGVLTSGLGWRWVLFVNVPIGVIAALLAPRLIDESRAEAEQRNFDVAGAVSVTAGLSILVYALVDAQSAGWGSLQTVALLAISVLLLGAFVLIESRAGAPLVPFRIFRQQTVAGANVTGLLIGASLFSMFSAGAARGAGTDRDRAGVVRAVSPDGSFASDILGPSLVAAVWLGFSFVPVTIAAVAGISNRDQGLASGLINTSQQVGGALGLAVLATIANSRTASVLSDAHGASGAGRSALTDGFQSAFLTGAALAVLGFVLAFLMISREDSRRHVEAAVAESTA